MWSASVMPTSATKKSGSEKSGTQGGSKHPLGHTLWFREICRPRGFDTFSGSHAFLNQFFLIGGSDWFNEKERM